MKHWKAIRAGGPPEELAKRLVPCARRVALVSAHWDIAVPLLVSAKPSLPLEDWKELLGRCAAGAGPVVTMLNQWAAKSRGRDVSSIRGCTCRLCNRPCSSLLNLSCSQIPFHTCETSVGPRCAWRSHLCLALCGCSATALLNPEQPATAPARADVAQQAGGPAAARDPAGQEALKCSACRLLKETLSWPALLRCLRS